MLKPDVTEVLKTIDSRYSLVIATAKRAREIAAKAEQDEEILIEKPVKIASDEIVSGKLKVVNTR